MLLFDIIEVLRIKTLNLKLLRKIDMRKLKQLRVSRSLKLVGPSLNREYRVAVEPRVTEFYWR